MSNASTSDHLIRWSHGTTSPPAADRVAPRPHRTCRDAGVRACDGRGRQHRLGLAGSRSSSAPSGGATQSEMAEAMGISGATLTHHLNALEDQGLVRRWRESSNRRVQHVELTDAGVELFDRLREVATRHDQRLRAQLSDEETARLAELLGKLQAGLESPDP